GFLREEGDRFIDPVEERLGIVGRAGAAFEADVEAGFGEVEAAEQREESALAAAALADEGDAFAAPDRQVEVVEALGALLLVIGWVIGEIDVVEVQRVPTRGQAVGAIGTMLL